MSAQVLLAFETWRLFLIVIFKKFIRKKENYTKFEIGSLKCGPVRVLSGVANFAAIDRSAPFDTFSEIHFWPTDPKIFLKAPLAPIYTNFEGERAPKKNAIFLSKFFKKCPKTAFLTVFFFQKFACGATKFAKIGAKQCFGGARKINLVDLKKRSKFSIFFWKSAPPPSRKS